MMRGTALSQNIYVGALQPKLNTESIKCFFGMQYEQIDIEQPTATRPEKRSCKKASSSAAKGGDPSLVVCIFFSESNSLSLFCF